jgi:hypothetical protein
MSQFILCKGKKDSIEISPSLLTIEIEDNDFFIGASQNLFPGSNIKEIWSVVNKQTNTIDSLFTDAQREISNGYSFQTTELSKLINSLISFDISFCLWYGSDWNELPIVSKNEVLNCIIEQLVEMPGEVYLRYWRRHGDGSSV